MFKTYEGKLIQSGIRSPTQGNIQSNEFKFSVTNEHVADELNKNSGAYVELHYKEYLHTLPWRGVSEFVVDSVMTVKPVKSCTALLAINNRLAFFHNYRFKRFIVLTLLITIIKNWLKSRQRKPL